MTKEELLKKAYVERDISWRGCNLNCVKACS